VIREKIFTGNITKSIRNVTITNRDRSPGTCLKWLDPLIDRPLIDKMTQSRGKLKATPNIVVCVPGWVSARYSVASAPSAKVYGVIVAWNMLTGRIQGFRQIQPCQNARRLAL